MRVGVAASPELFQLRCIAQVQDWCAKHPSDWQCAAFPSGSGILVRSGRRDPEESISYRYVNHLKEQVYRRPWSFSYPDDYDLAEEHCYIELGTMKDFPELSFCLGSGFEDAVLAVTQERGSGSACRDLSGWIAHDQRMKILTKQRDCDLGLNSKAKLLEISMP